MAVRTALLNGNVINRDADFSKHIEAVCEPGVISGLAVSSSSVATGEAFVKCERTNGDTIYALVYITTAQSISGDGDVYIEIPQEIIDNGELASEEGTDIATIEVGTMPDKNALKLATKSGSTITDARNMIKKVGELLDLINTNIEDIEDLDERVEHLEEADAINHLDESGLVGVKYNTSTTLIRQYTPTLSNSSKDCYIGNVSANAQIHIQGIASGTESNKIKLKVKKIGSPTTNLIVEVRLGTKIETSSEAYWYGGGSVIASGSISYSNISTSYAEKTITLDNNFGGTRGQLLDVVVYQTNTTVNDTNYYSIACDSTQYGEAFSYVSVNGNTRTRSQLMPYCLTTGLENSLFSKFMSGDLMTLVASASEDSSYSNQEKYPIQYTATKSGRYHITYGYNGQGTISCYVDNTTIASDIGVNGSGSRDLWTDVEAGQVIKIKFFGLSYKTLTFTGGSVYAPEVINSVNQIPLYPSEVKSIGQRVSLTSYGTRPSNNVYYGGIMTGTDTRATTGEITLGNAVGYITVNFNGEIVKIPYYGN